ncbi:hypothetical protein G9U51_16175 [Calidifontibacter sp. DB0510]|uniref:Cell wall anchor protein n=1 Tax=Metallococcus carri TaxID=1656884 RepID=A0A967B3I3_9MICO|nr:choice-of-anchor P family protein [Metallococcus carri]NHN57309.1 hypothetical protein [Metallococcus carri]NOP38086.1 hypothetical protein [Calidifontibacter sp. DB2511S]
MSSLRSTLFALLAFALTLATGVAAPTATASTGPTTLTTLTPVPLSSVGYSTYAYASYISGALAGSGITSGTTSWSAISCTATPGLTRTNSLASVNAGAVTTGTVASSAQSIGTTSSRTARSTVSVQSLRALSGLITADAVRSTSTSTYTSAGAASGTNSTTLTNLRINGVAISATTAPNTTIALRLNGSTIGRVVVNAQSKAANGPTVTTQTTALDVTMTSQALGLGAGARIVIGRSYAALPAVPAGFAGGFGYSLKATAANGVVKTGPLSYMSVPCSGGTASASVASGSVPSVLTAGAAKTTTSSTTYPTLSSRATNTIASANVLNGLISASAIVADTTTTRATRTATPVPTDRSSFGSLKVTGFPLITPAVAPNTTVTVPGLGRVTFHKVTRTTTGIQVTMIYIVLGQALGALPTGSVIELGVSNSSVR